MERQFPTLTDVHAARERVRQAIDPSPLTHSPFLSELCGRSVYLKWDNKLRTGSFKERGAVNFLSMLGTEARRRGVLAASAGNHALAVAFHAARMRIPCRIVMPRFAPLVKVQSTRRYGAKVILQGADFNEAFEEGQRMAEEEGLTFVPGFDHAHIVAGQGTIALEILEQLPEFDAVIAPVGGGGLLAGIAVVMAELQPSRTLFGVQSQWVREQREAAPRPGGFVPATIADGIAVKRLGALPAAIIAEHVKAMLAVSETAIAAAIIQLLQGEKSVVEGAGAAALAALLSGLVPQEHERVVIVISGSNIDMSVLARLIERDMAEEQRLLHVKVSVPDRPGSLARVVDIVAHAGGNIVRVLHDRSFSALPGNVDISVLLEVHDKAHRDEILGKLDQAGLPVTLPERRLA